MTSSSSITAMTFMVAPQRGQTSGSTSVILRINRAQLRRTASGVWSAAVGMRPAGPGCARRPRARRNPRVRLE